MHINVPLALAMTASTFLCMASAAPQASNTALTSAPSTSASPDSYCIPIATDSYTQNALFAGLVDQFYVQKDVAGTFHKYMVADYIQHNPFEGQGAAASAQFLGAVWPGWNVTVLRYGVDKDLGWIHSRVDGASPDGEPVAIVDIFRWNGSCVVEHWDVIQARPQNATNPLAMF